MERNFYIITNEWGEENVIEERTADDIVREFTKLYPGNPIRTLWILVDFMKSNYENGNDEMAEIYYEAIVAVIKDALAPK